MLPTPSTSHVSFDTIYEPAEDSFLLLDTLSGPSETQWLRQRLQTPSSVLGALVNSTCRLENSCPLVVEVGTGSGVVIAFLAANAKAIFGQPMLALGLDINTNACKATQVTVQKASIEQDSKSVYLGSFCADLSAALRARSVDVLVFNPPYVPTSELPVLPNAIVSRDQYEHDSHLLSLSYAGGRDGMETTNRLLHGLPEVLSSRGVAYILLCAQNKPEDVKAMVRKWPGTWHTETAGRSGKTAGWEKLEIIRIWQEAPIS